jgi:glycosyltransferase involved in cell wall biosynthesis
MASMTKISAAIITYNEERNIRRCLESLKSQVDEIVVVDSDSSDATRAICEEFETRFIVNAFEGHIQQKNFAIAQCNNEWVLSLDADEALTDELAQSIKAADLEGDVQGYSMNRLTNYCGKWIRHSGWYPDRKLRLFQKSTAGWGGVNPHDKIIMERGSKTAHLKGDLLHYSFYTRDDHIKQIHYFTDISSKALFDKGKRINSFMLVLKVMAKFLKSFVVRLGFLDGRSGFAIARNSAWATWLKYTKLRNLRKGVDA